MGLWFKIPPYLQLHLLVFILAITAILGRLIGLPAPALVLWRTVLAAGILLLWQAFRGEGILKISTRPARFKVFGTGALLGAHWILFFGSIQLANVSICLAGMATISFFTALVEPLMNKTRLGGSDLLLGLMVVPGLLLIAGAGRSHGLGLACSLMAALLAAVFSVLNRRFALQGLAPEAVTFYEMIGAALFCALVLPFFGLPARALLPSAGDVFWLLVLAGLCTAFAFSFYVHLLRRFTAFTSNLAASFEPVYGILLAVLLFGEHREFQPTFYLGVLVILAANLLHVIFQRQKQRKYPSTPLGIKCRVFAVKKNT